MIEVSQFIKVYPIIAVKKFNALEYMAKLIKLYNKGNYLVPAVFIFM
ncbi:MAG: hypothetical protein LBK53_07020 [Heliobacteriaceae bacterium]|jgi:hypothetical protein|nr:hypothetical protein [Heliobacteriaceae bacterium]